jgi:SPP1 family predicted phage head-tail adaptor
VRARIGRLRHRLTLEAGSRANDGGGGTVSSWEPLAELWGAVEAATGRETVAADRVTGRAAYVIIVRYRDDVAPAMRFRRGTEVFDILAALDKDGRRRFLVCQCERRDL